VEELGSKFPEDTDVRVYVGAHFWNQIPKMWKYKWIQRESVEIRSLVPWERTEIEVCNATIILDK